MGRHKRSEKARTVPLYLPADVADYITKHGGPGGSISFSREVTEFLRNKYLGHHPADERLLEADHDVERLDFQIQCIKKMREEREEKFIRETGMSRDDMRACRDEERREDAVRDELRKLNEGWNYIVRTCDKRGFRWLEHENNPHLRPYNLTHSEAKDLIVRRQKPQILRDITADNDAAAQGIIK